MAVGEALGDAVGVGEPGAGVGVAVGTGEGLGVGLGVGVANTVEETVIDVVVHGPCVPAGLLCQTMFCPLPPFVVRFDPVKPAMLTQTFCAPLILVGPVRKFGTVHVAAFGVAVGIVVGMGSVPEPVSNEVTTTAVEDELSVKVPPTSELINGVTRVNGVLLAT